MTTQKELKILFTSIGRRVELVQQFRSAAAKLGIRLQIIGADITTTAPALAFCDQTVIVPRITDSRYIPTLVEFCQSKCVDALVPTIDTDLLLLAEQKSLFSAVGTTVFISNPDKIRLCRDKRRTSDYFHSLGLHAPSSCDVVSLYNGGFPAFIKPVDGSSSIGANRANSMDELQFFASQLPEYVIQPFIAGTEYTVDIFCDLNGLPIFITPRIRQAVRAGEVLKTQICHQPDIEQEMLRLISDFSPCGAITVQLIRDEKTGINHYIEINPRFGGGAPLSMKAGANSAEALLRIIGGQHVSYHPLAASDGAIYSRFDQSVCVNQQSVPLKAVVFDLDDTLYSEKEYIKSGYRRIAELLPQVDSAADKLWDAFLSKKPAIDEVLHREHIFSDDLKSACLQAYRQHMPDIHLYSGIRDLLVALRQKGIQIGILTDGRPEGQRAKLQALGLYDLVDSVLITDELGGSQFRKPCDLPFRIMQARLGVPFESILYVGDNPAKDFHAPKVLGMQWLHFANEDGIYYSEGDGNYVCSVSELTSAVWEKL